MARRQEVLIGEEVEEIEMDEDDEELYRPKERTIRVSALRGSVPYYGLSKEGKRVLQGRVGYTDYDKDKALRTMLFQTPRTATQEEKTYSLGIAKGTFQVIDPAMVLRPLLNLGFQIRTTSGLRGGSRSFTSLTHPKLVFEDVIDWDLDQYAEAPKSKKLFFSIGAWIDARASSGIHLAGGFFREVCTNGLISMLMGLGKVQFSHKRWNQARLVDWAQTELELAGHGDPAKFPQTSSKALKWVTEILQYSVEAPERIAQLPEIAQVPIRQLTKIIPDGARLELAAQFSILGRARKSFSPLDQLNALTNAAKRSHGAGMAMRQERVFHSLVELTQLGALRADVSYNSIPRSVN